MVTGKEAWAEVQKMKGMEVYHFIKTIDFCSVENT